MKYGLRHDITLDIKCETGSPEETVALFTAYLAVHVPEHTVQEEFDMWTLCELPRGKASRPCKLKRTICVDVNNVRTYWGNDGRRYAETI